MMKTCPRCNKQYQDPSLNFCLDDGTPLVGDIAASPPTVVLNPQQTAFQSQHAGQPTWNLAQAQQKPARSAATRVLLWVGGILGALALLCGGGIAGLVYFGNKLPQQGRTNGIATTPTAERRTGTTPTPSSSTTPDAKNDVTKAQFDAIKVGMDRKEVEKIMGSPGEEYYRGVGGGISFVSVKWVGQKFKTIFVSYRDNKVTSTTQVGLDPKT